MSHIYLAAHPRPSHGKTGKACAVTNFPTCIDLTLSNVVRYCFGADDKEGRPTSYCQTTVRFKDGYRSQANFEEADVIPLDIDGAVTDGDAADWQSKYKPILEKVGLQAIAYPSLSRRCHVFLPLSRPVKTVEEYRAVVKAVLQALKAKYPELKDDLDPADKDGARMLFEGAAVDNPGEWAFEIKGKPVNVENALEYARNAAGDSENSHNNMKDKQAALEVEGNRNKTAYQFALYAKAHSKDEDEAYAAYLYMVKDTTLDRAEVDSVFKSAMKADVLLGSDLDKRPRGSKNKLSEDDVADAAAAIEKKARAKFRRAVESVDVIGRQAARLKSDEIYALHDNAPGSGKGCATNISTTAYETAIFKMIEDEAAGDHVLEMRLKRQAKQVLSPLCLDNYGLLIPDKNLAFFMNGIFETYGAGGRPGVDFEFKPLPDNSYLISPYPWNYEINPALIIEGIKWINTIFPPRDGMLLSPESAIFIDFLRSMCGRITSEQICLWIQGIPGAGKTKTIHDDLGLALGGAPFYMKGDNCFIRGTNRGFDGATLQDVVCLHYDEFPFDSRVNSEIVKEFISEGDMEAEKKNGALWKELKKHKDIFTSNDLPHFSTGTDDGLNRKMRFIKACQDLRHSKNPAPLSQDLMPGIRALINAALRMPAMVDNSIYKPLYETYPLKREWLEMGSEAGLWKDLLIPSQDAAEFISIGAIKGLLRGANEAIGKLPVEKISRLLKAAGYPVKPRGHMGGKDVPLRVQGYIINPLSIVIKDAKKDFDSDRSGYISGGGDLDHCPTDEDAYESYYESIKPLLADYCAHLEAIIEGHEGVCESRPKVRREVKSAPHYAPAAPAGNQDRGFYDETTADVTVSDPAPVEPAFSAFPDVKLKSGNSWDTAVFYDGIEPWFKENGCLRDEPLNVEGARWCGKEYGRNNNHLLFINLIDIVRRFLPLYSYTYYKFRGARPADPVDIVQGRYDAGSLEDKVSRAFLEGFNEGVKLQK